MSNYPPGTWNADPRAPWNEETPRTCDTCAHADYLEKSGDLVCMAKVERRVNFWINYVANFRASDVVDAVESALVYPEETCEDWGEA